MRDRPQRAVFSILLAAWAAALPAATREEDLREAARLDAERNCAEAERLYRRAAAGAPDSPALWNNLGNHYLVCGQPEQARTWFERLLRVNPSHANANLQLARLAIARKQETKALEYLRQVPDSGPAVRLLRAEALYGAGQRTAALAEFNGLQNESDAAVLAALGLTTARLGLFDRAEAAFQAALARRPGDLGLMFYLGRAAARAQHYDRARQVLDVVLARQPENIEVLFELGRVYAALHDPSRAVYLLSQARQRAPRSPEILLALARAAEDAGYYGDAALAYDGYLTLRPTDDAARRDRALVYGYSGSRLAEGIAELTSYLQRYPRDPIAHYDLAQLIWKTEPEKALDQLHAAIRLKADFPSALFSRAWLLHRLGRTTEALPDLQAAARLAPGNPRVLALLGVVHLALDQPAEAERCLRQALSGAPEDPAILMHLGRALMELGREQEAQPFLAKFQQVRPRMARVPRQEAGMIELATLSQSDRTRREIERLRRDARSHPGDPGLQLALASLLLADGRIEEASAEFHELLTRNPDLAVWERAGATLAGAEQYALARQFLEKAAASRPSALPDLALALFFTDGPQSALPVLDRVPPVDRSGDYFLLRARMLDAAGEQAEAGKMLTEGLRQISVRPEAAWQAALLLLSQHRDADALAMLDRSLHVHPDDAGLRFAKAAVQSLLHQSVEARKSLREIEARWPEWDRPYLADGLLLSRTGNPAEARRQLQTAAILGGTDPAARCALANLSGMPEPDPRCACLTDLRRLLTPCR